jgi:probable rRNA maturation factor
MDQNTGSLSVVLTGKPEMQSLNLRYRGKNYATDVLSFSYPDAMMEEDPFLGEIVLSPEIAAEQAFRWRVAFNREFRKLLLHGILHLLGYDHESDRGQMKRTETALMRRKFFMDGPALSELKDKR